MMKVLLTLLCIMEACFAYRILGFFPFPIKSHHLTYAPIMYELARRGHQVVYFTPIPSDFSHPNLEVRTIPNFKSKYLAAIDLDALGRASVPVMTSVVSSVSIEFAEEFYGHPEAQKIIHGNDSFDAVLLESLFAQEPATALLHKFGCVAVEIAALGDCAWVNEISGLPDNPAYQIDFKTDLSDTLTLKEKLYNFYVTWSTTLVRYYYLWKMQGVMDKYFNYTGWEDRPPIYQLVSNRSMILRNRDVLTSYPYPMAPHVKDIGGVNIAPNKPLPKDIKKAIEDAPNGVIYFSLGSNLNTSDFLASGFGDAFMNVFRSLPKYNILLKWENEKHISLPPNVKTFKWLPQQDVLAHKKCVLFITHGGYNSLTESVYHGVPILGIPFFGDQPKNLRQVERAGFGIKLFYRNITQSSVAWAINELLNNPRYKNEAMKRSRMMKERKPAVEEAAYWVEFAIKYPNALTPRAAFLSFIQLHMIDVYLIIFTSFLVMYKLMSIVFSFIKGKTIKEKVKTS